MKSNNQKNSDKPWRMLSHLFGATKRFSYPEQCKACEQKELTQYGRSVILFGRLVLNAATDDFVVFGYVQFIGRSFCLLLLGIIISLLLNVRRTEGEILIPTVIFYLIVGLTGITFLNTFGYLMLGTQSCRGSIWDKKEDIHRRYVYHLLHIVIILGIVEYLVLLVVIGLVLTTKENSSFHIENLTQFSFAEIGQSVQCIPYECKSTEERWKVVSELLIVLISFLTINGIYKVLKYSKFFYGMGKGLYHLMKVLCCCCKGTIKLIDETGELVDKFFPAKCIVSTDVIAGMTYLHARTKHNRDRNSGVITDEIQMNFSPSWTDPDKLLHYARYAEATYASKLLMIHPGKYCGNFYNILSNLICPIFCCFPTCSKPGYVYKDSCCLSNTAVLKSLVSPKLCDLKNPPLFVNYESSAKDITKLKTPFAVIEDTHDKENKAIVIAIRGTSQPADLLIDAVATPKLIWDKNENFPTKEQQQFWKKQLEQQQQLMDDKEDESWKKFMGHFGMIVAARNIFQQIKSQEIEVSNQTQRRTILDMLDDEYKDHQIIVTGHSLGAGTAVVLGLLLRSEKTIRNRLKVYAYGVPGGLLNKSARDESMKFMVSVIHNDDVISRLSIRSIVRLRNEVRKTLLECKEPKYKIINTGFCAALGAIGKCCFGACCCCSSCTDKMAVEAISHSKERLCCPCLRVKWSKENEKGFRDIEEGNAILECTCANSVDKGEEMLPAGTLLHLVPISNGAHLKYSLKVVDDTKFKDINVCSNMVSDHMPSEYIKSLRIVCEKWKSLQDNE